MVHRIHRNNPNNPPTPPKPPSHSDTLGWDPDASNACGQAYVGISDVMSQGWSPDIQSGLKNMITPLMEQIQAGYFKLTGKDLEDAQFIYRHLSSSLYSTGGLFDADPKTGPTTYEEASAIAGDRSYATGTVNGDLMALQAIFNRQD